MAPQEASLKEKEWELEKGREKEKENKREGRKDLEKRSKAPTPDGSPSAAPGLFTVDGRDLGEPVSSLASKKASGRKKSTSADAAPDAAPPEVRGVHSAPPSSVAKARLPKKGRPTEKGAEMEDLEKDKEKQIAPNQQAASVPGQPGKQQLSASSLGSVTDKKVVGLLRKAQAQLFEIKKSKLKPADQTKVQVSFCFFSLPFYRLPCRRCISYIITVHS